jgi:hypothetical protein
MTSPAGTCFEIQESLASNVAIPANAGSPQIASLGRRRNGLVQTALWSAANRFNNAELFDAMEGTRSFCTFHVPAIAGGGGLYGKGCDCTAEVGDGSHTLII